MQLSNFWRDIGQDWGIGRVYIPLEDMERFGYSEADLANYTINDNLKALLRFEFQRTEDFYKRARTGVAWLASGQWGVMSALEIYHAIMPAIARNGFDVFHHRAETTKRYKSLLVAKARGMTLWANLNRPPLSKRPLAEAWLAPREQTAQQ
jgi:phytoene synthase